MARGRDFVVVGLFGDLSGDLPAGDVERNLDRAVDEGTRRVRLDLAGVDAIDLEGIGVLIHLLREYARRGRDFSVERARGQVEDKLRTTGALRYLEAAS